MAPSSNPTDFGSRLLSDCRELYKSKNGTLTANEELELVILDLRALVRKLEASFPLVEPDASPNLVENYSEEQKLFRTICDKAANVAEELLSRLERIKVKDGKKRKWKSFEQALRGAWSHDEVRVLDKRLSTLREALENSSPIFYKV
jgi:hypothetical protein